MKTFMLLFSDYVSFYLLHDYILYDGTTGSCISFLYVHFLDHSDSCCGAIARVTSRCRVSDSSGIW